MTLPACIALVDCDAFYCSCQVVFEPELEGRPLIVLGSNDGNVIARSKGAKAIGIAMGAPAFEYRQLIERGELVCRSANFATYADLSRRVMEVLALFAGPDLEIYSIDEGFLDLSSTPLPERVPTARRIRETVRKWTGISVSIGLGPTKVLAKLASRLAKGEPGGVVDLTDPTAQEEALCRTPVQDLWMVGPRRAQLLNQAGIYSAQQLRGADERWIKQHLHVGGLRLVYELRGMRALPLELVPSPPQAIARARAFGRPVTELSELQEAVAAYLARVGEKLRARQRAARVVSLYLATNRYRTDQPQYRNSCVARLPEPTNATPELVRVAQAALARIFRPGYSYHRVGVLVIDLVPASPIQLSWYVDEARRARLERLMRVIDEVNAKFGRDTLRFASLGFDQTWGGRAAHLSCRFTTRWREIVVVYAL